MNVKQKMLGITRKGNEKKIVVTHVTIRESISFLVLRLIVIEIFVAFVIIGFDFVIRSTNVGSQLQELGLPLFLILVVAKTCLMIFVVFQWVHAYYEITPNEIIHKRGFIFQHQQRYMLHHLGSVIIEQGLIGRLLNYGTLKFYNWTLEKDVMLYLIHNPIKYYHILQSILPDADEEKEIIAEHLRGEERI